MKKLLILLTLTLLVAGGVMADEQADGKMTDKSADTSAKMQTPKEKSPDKTPKEPPILTKESGVRYQDLVVGKGVEAKNGTKADCYYTLWLADSTGLVKEKMIQSNKDSGKPFQCTVGYQLIAGWSDGMTGMKEGGTRRIFVPWKLGYGERGMGGGMIPGKSNLIFEIVFIKAL